MQVPLIPLKASPVASMSDGGHKSVTQQQKAIKQAVQHFAALGRAVDTLVEAKLLASFKPFANLALAYSDYYAFNKRGKADLCHKFDGTLTGKTYSDCQTSLLLQSAIHKSEISKHC